MRAEERGLDVVRLPLTAYGPFDGAIAQPAARPDASAGGPHPPREHVDCPAFPDPPDDDEETMSAPFDNCPRTVDGHPFNKKATIDKRSVSGGRNADSCCYTIPNNQRGRVIKEPID